MSYLLQSNAEAVKSLWVGRMSVDVRGKSKNADTGATEFEIVTVIADEPCRVSFSNSYEAQAADNKRDTDLEIKLFCAADLEIPAGSRITVTQNGETSVYAYSGIAAVYSVHQEIVLRPFERWA